MAPDNPAVRVGAALVASLVVTLTACTATGPSAQSNEVQGQRGLVRVETEGDGEGYVSTAPGGLAGIGDSTLGEAPESTCLIKGNISFNSGERIYHVPGQEYYDDTVINEDAGERWFCTEREALDAGWRKSKV